MRRRRIEHYKEVIRDALPELKREFPFVMGAYLFGSAGRGKRKPRDIDNEPALVRFQRTHPEMKREAGPPEHSVTLRAPYFAKQKLSQILEQRIGLEVGTEKQLLGWVEELGLLHLDPHNPAVARYSLLKKAERVSVELLPPTKKRRQDSCLI